jgi:hypothetical protein
VEFLNSSRKWFLHALVINEEWILRESNVNPKLFLVELKLLNVLKVFYQIQTILKFHVHFYFKSNVHDLI